MTLSAYLRKVQSALTHGYARLTFGKVSEVEYYRVGDIEREVYWVDSEDVSLAGQNTIFGTIILNRRELDKFHEEMTNYVFLHEVGHSKSHLTIQYLLLMLQFLFTVASVIGIPVLFVRVIQVALSMPSVSYFITYLVAQFIAVAIVVGLTTLIWWLSEGQAELFAVREIGIGQYTQLSEEMLQKSDRGPVGRLLHLVRYPPANLIVWIAKRVQATPS